MNENDGVFRNLVNKIEISLFFVPGDPSGIRL